MTRYRVWCSECGEIEADTDDGLFSLATAHRRAGFHEGTEGNDPPHYITVSPATDGVEGDA